MNMMIEWGEERNRDGFQNFDGVKMILKIE